MISFVKFIGISFREVFAPKNCVICEEYFGDRESYSKYICNKCFDSMPYSPSKEIIYNQLLMAINLEDLFISNATSLFSADVMKKNWIELIHLLKYNGFTNIGTEFGILLGKRLIKEDLTGYDFVIPVPIHHTKKRERGYNQSDFIALSVSKTINCTYSNKLIKRMKYTSSQTLLDSNERRKNISKVFGPYNKNAHKLVDGKDILIIDDVLTTGSTLNECASTLVKMGANSVDVATLAHA